MIIEAIERKRIFISYIVYIIILGTLGILSTYFKWNTLSIIIMLSMILPIFFINLFIRKFSRILNIEFQNDGILFNLWKNGEAVSELEIKFKEISTYIVQYPNEKFVSIKFNLISRRETEYSFFRTKHLTDQPDGEQMVKKFIQAINSYNDNNGDSGKIYLKPSFYASRKGLYLIVFLAAILFFAIFYISSFTVKSIPLTFLFSAILIMQLILKRKSDLAVFNENSE